MLYTILKGSGGMLEFLLSYHTTILQTSWLLILLSSVVCVAISFENRPPVKTLSWLLVLILLPGLGLIFFLLFGENLRKSKWNQRRQTIQEYLESEDVKAIFDPETLDTLAKRSQEDIYYEIADRNIMHMVLRSGQAPITINNHIDIYTEGQRKFEQMMEDIANAKHHIHLEYFIIKDCVLGRKLHALLLQKAQEGVEIRLLYDDIGSWRLYFKPSFMHTLRKAGIEAKSYVQARFPYLHRKLNYRNHRKICVIDGQIGYVGGLNIGDEYVHQDEYFGFWRDTHLRIEGPAVYFLQTVFITDWLVVTGRRLLSEKYFPKQKPQRDTSIVQIATSGADSPNQTIYEAYFYAIAQAKESIYIQTPYFIPDESLLTAIHTAALSGVDIKIIFPGVMDHFTVYNASLSYLEQVMAWGAEVYFYDKQPGPSFIHSKVVLVDHEIASVGTANIDIRSFIINSEINAFIYDNKTVNRLYQMFADDLKDSRRLQYETFRNKTFMQRGKESLCRLFSPLL